MNLRPELEKRGLIAKPTGLVQMIFPAKPTSHSYEVAEVLALKGDAAKGKIAAGRCIMCHQIDQIGAEYGPALKGFGSRQPPEVIAKTLIDPSADIAHGYEGSSLKLTDGKWIDGQIIADGDPIMIRSTGGFTQKIPTQQLAERHKMDRSLMLSADQLSLTAQDVADIIEWMKTY